MPKKFNVTGTCFADEHYMADVSAKLEKTAQMIEDGEYFIINRPRQYGKTTTLNTLEKTLKDKDEYLVLDMSFEGIGDAIFEDEKLFCVGFVELLSESAEYTSPELVAPFLAEAPATDTMKKLAQTITILLNKTNKKVVLFIDEVDKSSNNQLFVSFLAMLRTKYLNRQRKSEE